MRFHKLFATSLGIGYIGKGGGTVAAVACCICWYLAWAGSNPAIPAAIITVCIFFVGVWSSNRVIPVWGKDPSKVVIDEVAGMCISMLFIPVTVKYLICALFLFRFFDIVKPLYIKKTELLPGGWGVMTDDVVAGAYTNILLQAVVAFNLF